MSEGRTIEKVLPYVAELGMVGFIATASVAAIGVASELVSPGLVFNLVAPQGIAAVMVLAGALSLLSERSRRGLTESLLYAVISLAISASVTFAAWRYFEALPFDRGIITVAAGGTAILVFIAAFRAARRDFR
ncbi:MAG: hypothetical protein U9Q03_00170 [Patescibacteria group bacterium]|nr:hypothetical protein [Patescibacteria group bacterium]